MSTLLPVDDEVHELKLGKTFQNNSNVAFHSIRYDFKPASVDTSQAAIVDIGEGDQVTVTVPHVSGSGTTQTVFKGNKKQSHKDCVLVIDHTTGELTLEKLSCAVQVKKTRAEGSTKIQQPRPLTPVEKKVKSPKKKQKVSTKGITTLPQTTPPYPTASGEKNPPSPHVEDIQEIADSSSDSSGSNSEREPPTEDLQSGPVVSNQDRLQFLSKLKSDLHLSDSDTDSE